MFFRNKFTTSEGTRHFKRFCNECLSSGDNLSESWGRNDNQPSPDCTAVYPSQKRTASRLIKQLGQFKVDARGTDPGVIVGCTHILHKTFTYLNRKESMVAFQCYLSCKEIQCYWDVHFDGPRFLPPPLLSSPTNLLPGRSQSCPCRSSQ